MKAIPKIGRIKTGRYRHYKGDVMNVIGIARHSETLEPLVIYEHKTKIGNLWARPYKMFFEKMIVDGKKVLRFTLVKGKGRR